MTALEDALAKLTEASKREPRILVSFSGGKESMIVLDLVARTGFTEVICFYMYLVPGLAHIEAQLKWAEKRYGVTVLQYPHFSLPHALKGGAFTNPSFRYDDLPDMKLHDVYRSVMEDTGIKTIATGMRKADGVARRRNFAQLSQVREGRIVQPLAEWNKFDVLAYLELQKLPRPKSSDRAMTGVGLGVIELCWLYDTYPEDFAKLCRVFPFAEAVIKRREFYGIPEKST